MWVTAGMSEHGTGSFSIPNSAFSAAVICRRRPCTTSATISIWTVSQSISNQSATSSRRTDGAKGRNNARYFPLRLKSDCMVGERASPRIERAPGARGPNSMRPWHQPIARPAARSPALFSTITSWVNRGEAGSGGRQAGVNIVIGERRTQKGAAHHLRAGGDHARHVAHAVIGRQRGTKRAAGIAICMLHPHLREPSVAHHAAIGHAVESHTACQA